MLLIEMLIKAIQLDLVTPFEIGNPLLISHDCICFKVARSEIYCPDIIPGLESCL